MFLIPSSVAPTSNSVSSCTASRARGPHFDPPCLQRLLQWVSIKRRRKTPSKSKKQLSPCKSKKRRPKLRDEIMQWNLKQSESFVLILRVYGLVECLSGLDSVSSRCLGMSPRSPPERSGFVQIDQSGIRLPRLSRWNNYINYLCLHFRIHFTFFTWYLLRTFSGMFCVTDIAFYVLQKLTDFLAKQNHDLLQSAREYSWQEHQLQLVIHAKPLIKI